MKSNRRDLRGQIFSRLTVVKPAPSRTYAYGTATMWWCLCTCGSSKEIRALDLLRGSTTSCGCLQRELARQQATVHGQMGTPEHRLWTAARDRHRRRGIPFTLTLKDIHIPEYCPVLGLRLEPGVDHFQSASPSLDRLNPDVGYVPGNVEVMSFRANALKKDASLEELKAVLQYMQKGPPVEALVVASRTKTPVDLKGDLLGLQFGKLRVTRLNRAHPSGNSWECLCDCGGVFTTPASQLAVRRSCGCAPRGATKGCGHKESSSIGRGSDRYELWRGAKGRARLKGLPFTIEVQGITIPDKCPVLGLELKPNLGGKTGAYSSPSLDRFDPDLGYTPENTVIICQRANSLKSDATLSEMTALVRWLSTKMELT